MVLIIANCGVLIKLIILIVESARNIFRIHIMGQYTAMQRLGSVRRKVGGKERHLRSKAVRVQQDPSVSIAELACLF